jgi:hypothetical protein
MGHWSEHAWAAVPGRIGRDRLAVKKAEALSGASEEPRPACKIQRTEIAGKYLPIRQVDASIAA